MVAKMADKKASGGKADPGRPKYTTLRIYTEDGEVLSDLAGKKNVTIADLYRELFAGKAKEMLIAETKKRLKQLEAE